MSAIPVQLKRVTLHDFYAREDLATVRSEFHVGEVLSMAGGSSRHSQISINLTGELRSRLKGSPCQAFDANLRTRIEASDRVVYPDLTVVCGPVEYDTRDKSRGTITNPSVVFEIISPSTERYDRTEKRDHYLLIPSLQVHVLVEQDRPRVEVITRLPDGRLELSFAVGLEGVLKLNTLGIEIPLVEIYDRVEFPPAEPSILADPQ